MMSVLAQDKYRYLMAALIGTALLSTTSLARGQAPSPDAKPMLAPKTATAPDLEELELGLKRKKVDEDTLLPTEEKAKALDLYDRAIAAYRSAATAQSELAVLAKRIDAAPKRIEELRRRLSELAMPAEAIAAPADATEEQLQGLVSEKQAAVGAAHEKVDWLKASLAELSISGGAIVREWVEREKNLKELTEETQAQISPEVPPMLREAQQSYLTISRRLEESKFELLRLRVRNIDLLVEVTTLERDVAVAELARAEIAVAALVQALQERREITARQARRDAEATNLAAVTLPVPIATIAKENAALQVERENLVRREKALSAEFGVVTQQYRRAEADLERLRASIKTYGASRALGRLLQRKINELPSPREIVGKANERQAEMASVTDRGIEVGEELQALSKIESRVDDLLASIKPQAETADPALLRRQTTELLTSMQNVLAELDKAYGRNLRKLTALNEAEQEFAAMAEDRLEFIRAQLTWIPNLSALTSSDGLAPLVTIAPYLSFRAGQQGLAAMYGAFDEHRLTSVMSLLVLCAVFAVRFRARDQLTKLAEKTVRVQTDAFAHTAKAVIVTVIAASAWPLLVAIVGWHLAINTGHTPIAVEIGSSLLTLTVFLFAVNVLLWVSQPYGLANRHFRWPTRIRDSVHSETLRLALVLIPAAFLLDLATQSTKLANVVGFGRPALLLGLAALALFFWRFFRRTGPFMMHMSEQHQDGWLVRLWFVWFPLIVGIPILLGIGSALGYQHTAHEVTLLLVRETTYLVVGLLLLRDLLLRWFYIAERRSRFEAAVEQRREARAESRQHEEDTDKAFFDPEVPEVNYRELGAQTRSLVGVVVLLGIVLGVGSLWRNFLPALGYLERVELPFSKVEMVAGIEQQSSVSLLDFAIGVLIVAGALFIAKNLSGLLEFTILRRTRLDAGGNYAIVTLCQYFIIAIGFAVAFSTIGLQWSKLQWLIAALGVGLGFGLQEIVANFVSGVILLLERPVRIGDIVTIGNVDGYVSRIQIRATTILTWERKELIVPNKEFITGQVINWTLSDGMNRIQFNVGIAYGSDVRKALDLMAEAVAENETVLSNPKPIITFETFGDNALHLVLRCYLPSMENRLATITALNEAIYEKFSDAGIVIAFPQRDVHLDISKPVEVRLAKGNVDK